jgi:hypothetical protein
MSGLLDKMKNLMPGRIMQPGMSSSSTLQSTRLAQPSQPSKPLSIDEKFNYGIIGAGVLLLIVTTIYVIAKYTEKYRDIRNVINTPVVASENGIMIKAADFPTTIPNRGIKFTISMWMYISSWMYNNNKDKDVFRKGDFRIYLDKAKNDLVIEVPMFPVEKATIKGQTSYYTTDQLRFVDFPIQKWVNVVIVVDGRSVDLWINGKLYQSLNLPNIIYFNNADNVYMIAPGLPTFSSVKQSDGSVVTVKEKNGTAGGYDGFLSGVVYYKYALSREDIVGLFERGPYPIGFVNKYVYRLLQYLFMKDIPFQSGKEVQFSKVGKSGQEIMGDQGLLDEYVKSNASTLTPSAPLS